MSEYFLLCVECYATGMLLAIKYAQGRQVEAILILLALTG